MSDFPTRQPEKQEKSGEVSMLRLRSDSPVESIPAPVVSTCPGAEGLPSSAVRMPDRGTRSIETLSGYIETVRSMTGASAACLLIDPVSMPGSAPLLLGSGDSPLVLGFETEAAALEWTAELARSGREVPLRPADDAVSYYRGAGENMHLFRVAISQGDAATAKQLEQGPPVERRQRPALNSAVRPVGIAWIGLRFDDRGTDRLFEQLRDHRWSAGNDELHAAPEWLIQALACGARMAWQVYELSALLRDSITGLTRRSELQVRLNHALMGAAEGAGTFALALINPDEFEQVNQSLGRAGGDAVLRQIGDLLQRSVRHPDSVYHYGGAVFAAHFWSSSEAEASRAAERLRKALSGHVYSDDGLRLDFSVGMVFHGAPVNGDMEMDCAEMLRRADSALNAAKASGGARSMTWAPRGFTNTKGSRDRLSGIFTADTRKDYRNMLLLWDTVQVISSHADTASIANEFVDRVNSTFKPNHAALVSIGTDARPRLLSASLNSSTPSSADAAGEVALLLSEEQRRLLALARRTQETQTARFVAASGKRSARQSLTAYAVPLPEGDHSPRCLYVDGPADSFRLDSADLVFLSVLAKQVAVALDRSELAQRWKQERERESYRLRAEVRELRQALQHSKFVYQSARMEEVLDVVRTVAPTDATVLITGESGTGKEMVARFLHDQSLRRRKDAFVTVDCGAIAPSLIETELFGHAKGAYTGANGASQGRIAQAEGGTLFLDEIGELPLDVQAKLLRFVQEREITPVGASRTRKIDARIVAATNRDLAAEVEAGRFRQDLYYRLRVISVTVPPLRERPDDILPLAQYFLETFAAQYEKAVCCFSADAQLALRRHSWAGNVRELQNQLLQAVIMSGEEVLGLSDLRLDQARGDERAPVDPASGGGDGIAGPLESAPDSQSGARSMSGEHALEADGDCEPWEALRRALARQVEQAIQADKGAANPLGVWLNEDLVMFAHEAYGGVARQASGVLGMAETTFRRQLEKITRGAHAFEMPRSPSWAPAKLAIRRLVRSLGATRDDNLVIKARTLLLSEVITRIPADDGLGSVLMGVTKPTYRRWKSDLSHSA